MKFKLSKLFYIFLGWTFVIIGVIGVVLPILPTVPFMILALACFSRSSAKFHQMLLNNRWFGSELNQWERTKTVARKSKKRATVLIILTFSISIALMSHRPELQVMLLAIASILLWFIWQLKERVTLNKAPFTKSL